MPVDRVFGVLLEIEAGFIRQVIHGVPLKPGFWLRNRVSVRTNNPDSKPETRFCAVQIPHRSPAALPFVGITFPRQAIRVVRITPPASAARQFDLQHEKTLNGEKGKEEDDKPASNVGQE